MERTTAKAAPMNVPVETEPARRRRRVLAALFGFALGVILALALSPRSHWLVRMQLAGRPALPDRAHLLGRAAEAMPNDSGVQAAWVAWNVGTEPKETRVPYAALQPMLARAPHSPVALAAALRLMAGGKEVTRVVEIAARGAQVDPENAFFLAMESAALFQGGDAAKGAAALAEAARRPVWNDYVADQVRGGWRLSDIAFGEGNVVARMLFMQDVDLSFYRTLGDAAGSAAQYAGRRERAGDLAAGYAIRHDLMALGERVRRDATTMTGSMAGVRITGAAVNHLYGREKPLTGFALLPTPEARAAMSAYLRAAGHPEDMAVAQALSERAAATRAFVFPDVYDWSRELMRFHLWVASASFLLLLAAWLGLFGLLCGGWRAAPPNATWFRKAKALQLPAACVVLILYGAVSLQTLRIASRINHDLAAMVVHEGRFYATLSGHPWPE